MIIRSHIIIGVLWLVLVGFGLFVMAKYESSPGVAGLPPQNWPSGLSSIRSSDKFTLVVFAHPRCPCTRATVDELAKLMTTTHDKMEAIVFVLSPQSMPNGWERTDIWKAASGIVGVKVMPDPDGKRASQFNSKTSGQTALYDSKGNLVFSGGITPARGRIGNSQGSKTITSLVNQVSLAQEAAAKAKMEQSTLVFGCPLQNPLSKPR